MHPPEPLHAMHDHSWAAEFPGAITVCDAAGTILWLNDEAAKAYAEFGGRRLVGKSLLDCHPEPARSRLERLLASGQSNVYTIERKGRKKLIYQAPWYVGGEYRGLVELALPLGAALPHFVRDET